MCTKFNLLKNCFFKGKIKYSNLSWTMCTCTLLISVNFYTTEIPLNLKEKLITENGIFSNYKHLS